MLPMKTRPAPAPWQVLLVGGSSGVGKTAATQQLARHLGVSQLLVDDVRLALQEFTSAEQYPDLHHLELALGAGGLSAEEICSGLIRVGELLVAPLATIIAHHVVVAGVGPVIIEGDGVTPQLATKTDFAGQKFFWGLRLADQVRSLFIVEPEEDVILANMRARGRGFDQLVPDEQRTEAHASWLYGQWLQREAAARGLAVIPARPWETLGARMSATLTP